VKGWPKKIKHRNRVLAKIYKSEGGRDTASPGTLADNGG
jgi:hypothetical protein